MAEAAYFDGVYSDFRCALLRFWGSQIQKNSDFESAPGRCWGVRMGLLGAWMVPKGRLRVPLGDVGCPIFIGRAMQIKDFSPRTTKSC